MARSVFVLNSEREKVVSAQFRRAGDELRGCGLKLEGPYADRRDAILEISAEVKCRMERRRLVSPIAAAIATLAPQNLPVSEGSWLGVPFVLNGASSTDCDSAGAVACSKIVETGSGRYREADLESLSMLGVAVLRRLGIPAFFAYQHLDHEHWQIKRLKLLAGLLGAQSPSKSPQPCILVMEKTPVMFGLTPPYMVDSPPPQWIAGIEILDDAALRATMQIKSAYLHVKSLMCDIASKTLEFPDEGSLRAMAIGHLLHEGTTSWPAEEAAKGLEAAKALLNSRETAITSMRTIAENGAVHNIVCPVHHSIIASDMILSEDARSLIEDVVRSALEGDASLLPRIAEMLTGHESFLRLMAYMSLAQEMGEHVHAQKECPSKTVMC